MQTVFQFGGFMEWSSWRALRSGRIFMTSAVSIKNLNILSSSTKNDLNGSKDYTILHIEGLTLITIRDLY